MKPGWKTTEFWAMLAVTILSYIQTSGAFEPDSMVLKVVGFLAAVLAALGYTAARSFVKVAEAKKEAALSAPKG